MSNHNPGGSGPVQNLVRQMEEYDNEIKKMQTQLRATKTKRIELEKRLVDFLQTNDQPGLKYQGRAYIYEQSKVHKRKPQGDKERDLKHALESCGMRASPAMISAVMNSLKGSLVVKDKITTKTYLK